MDDYKRDSSDPAEQVKWAGDRAVPQDVLDYQDAVDELGRLLSDTNIVYLKPLFKHQYWRVRKHAVMAARAALPRLGRDKKNEIESLIEHAKNDPDPTVSTIAAG